MYRQEFMDLAKKEALKSYQEDEVPIGSVIVKDGNIIAKAHNKKEKKQDSTAHSEIECIKKATKKLKSWHLDNCELYVTLEPCMMCTGAIINSRIKKVYFATTDPKGGSLQSNIKIKEVKGINHYPLFELVEDIEYINILKSYFKGKRSK